MPNKDRMKRQRMKNWRAKKQEIQCDEGVVDEVHQDQAELSEAAHNEIDGNGQNRLVDSGMDFESEIVGNIEEDVHQDEVEVSDIVVDRIDGHLLSEIVDNVVDRVHEGHQVRLQERQVRQQELEVSMSEIVENVAHVANVTKPCQNAAKTLKKSCQKAISKGVMLPDFSHVAHVANVTKPCQNATKKLKKSCSKSISKGVTLTDITVSVDEIDGNDQNINVESGMDTELESIVNVIDRVHEDYQVRQQEVEVRISEIVENVAVSKGVTLTDVSLKEKPAALDAILRKFRKRRRLNVNRCKRFRSMGRQMYGILRSRLRVQFSPGFYKLCDPPMLVRITRSIGMLPGKRNFSKLLAEMTRRLHHQRTRTDLLVDSQYRRRGNRALLNTGLAVLAHKFFEVLVERTKDRTDLEESDLFEKLVSIRGYSTQGAESLGKLEALDLVKRFLSARSYLVSKFKKISLVVRELIGEMLGRISQKRKGDLVFVEDLCTVGGHRSSIEPYFYDHSYFCKIGKVVEDEVLDDFRAFFTENGDRSLSDGQLERAMSIAERRIPSSGVQTVFKLRDSSEINLDYNVFGNFAMQLDENYDEEMKVTTVRSGDQIKGLTYWPCDRGLCMIPLDIGDRFKKLLIDLNACKDFRSLLAKGRFGKCFHSKHCRRNECNDDPCWNENGIVSEEYISEAYCHTKLGHSLSCLCDEDICDSELLLLKRLGVHFPEIHRIAVFLEEIESLDSLMELIDQTLMMGDLKMYVEVWGMLPKVNENFYDITGKESDDILNDENAFRFSKAAKKYQKTIKQASDCTCASCRQLYYRSTGVLYSLMLEEGTGMPTGIKLVNSKKGSKVISNAAVKEMALVWMIDKMSTGNIFLCKACASSLKEGEHSAISVFNGLEVDELPVELSCLTECEKPFVAPAKCFQNIYRLGNVRSNLPASDKARAHKGQVVYFPLPISETLRTVGDNFRQFPKDDHHILVNGVPTKNRVVWQSLVDFEKVKRAVAKLKVINPEYKDVEFEASLDDLSLENDMEVAVEDVLDLCKQFVQSGVIQGSNMTVVHDSTDPNAGLASDVHGESGESASDTNGNTAELPSDSRNESNSAGSGIEGEDRVRSADGAKFYDLPMGSMLTKISEEEMEYIIDTYSLQSLYKDKPPEDDMDLYRMERVQAKFLDDREKKLDLLCFPTLFPRGRGGQNEPRDKFLQNNQFIKSKLSNADARFRRDHQYIFFLLHAYRKRSILSGIFQMLRCTRELQTRSVSEVVDLVKKGDQSIESNLRSCFSQLRGSGEYWAKKRGDLKAMIRELGSPTWFLTLSAAEYDWDDMRSVLEGLNGDVPNVEKMRNGELCAFDPVNCSRHYEHRFREFWNRVIMNSEGDGIGVLGKCVAHYCRTEYQVRGARHLHILLWIEGAPKVNVNTESEVLEFIQKYATCRMPSKELHPDLHDLVSRYQVHKCNNYCRRRVTGSFGYRCRFGFPRIPQESAVLHDPIDSCRKRKRGMAGGRLYELRRTDEEIRVNDYNPDMDIQFLGDKTEAIVNYVVSYITKMEQAGLDEIWQEVGKSKSVFSQLFQFGTRCMSMRECGIYEAVDILLSHPLYKKSHTIRYLNVMEPSARMRCLKPLKMLESLADCDPESMDKFENNFVFDYYPNRPEELQDMCLYEFGQWYDRFSEIESRKKAGGRKKTEVEKNAADEENDDQRQEVNENKFLTLLNGKGFVRRRNKPHIITHKVFNMTDTRDQYFYALLMLFVPFRDETQSFRVEGVSLESLFFDKLVDPNFSRLAEYHQKLQDQQRIAEEVRDALAREDEVNEEENVEDPSIIGAPIEILNAMGEVEQMQKLANILSLDEYMTSMNEDQMRIFDKIITRVKEDKDRFMYVNGLGGSGKSFIIDGLRAWWKEQLDLQEKLHIVSAPTGIAASNVGGMTLHRLFRLPISNKSMERFEPLNDLVESEVYNSLRNLCLLIIDEISMVSSLNLAFIHLRLSQIFRRNCKDNAESNAFGKIKIVVMGDFGQLAPVKGDRIFRDLKSIEKSRKGRRGKPKENPLSAIGSVWASNLWMSCFLEYDELTFSVRQSTDVAFSELLGRLRYGKLNEEDVNLLKRRLINLPGSMPLEALVNFYKELRKKDEDVVCLLPVRFSVEQFNECLLKEMQTSKIYKLDAIDQIDSKFVKNKKRMENFEKLLKTDQDISDTAGLETTLRLCVGARVLLRRNLDVERSIVNGSLGTVVKIVVSGSEQHSDNDSVYVKLDKVDEVQAVKRVVVKFPLVQNVYVTRSQFPLILGWSMTIHKSQGLTLSQAIVDAGDTIFQDGMTYVALSRVRTLSGLHLINFNPAKATCAVECIHEINRLRKLYRKDLDPISVEPGVRTVVKDRHVFELTKKATIARKRRSVAENREIQAKKAKFSVPVEVETTCNESRKRKLNSNDTEPKKKLNKGQVQWPKFGNKTVNCYANSALQVLFNLTQFGEECHRLSNEPEVKQEMKKIWDLYSQRKRSTGMPIYVTELRKRCGAPFSVNNQESALWFTISLLESLGLIQFFTFPSQITDRCSIISCNHLLRRDPSNAITFSLSLTEVLDFSSMLDRWEKRDNFPCPKCGRLDSVEFKERICDFPRYLIIELRRYYPRIITPGATALPIFDNRSIEHFDPNHIRIEHFNCRVMGAVIHTNNGINDDGIHEGVAPNQGHYTALVRSLEYGWLKCNDISIEKTNFPVDLKNVVYFILEIDPAYGTLASPVHVSID